MYDLYTRSIYTIENPLGGKNEKETNVVLVIVTAAGWNLIADIHLRRALHLEFYLDVLVVVFVFVVVVVFFFFFLQFYRDVKSVAAILLTTITIATTQRESSYTSRIKP